MSNKDLNKKLKDQFSKNAEKFSKYYESYNENFKEVRNEAKAKYFQEGSKEYNSYLIENVFKNRKHKLPKKLDYIPVDQFLGTYEKYYTDYDLGIYSQEFWGISVYVENKIGELYQAKKCEKTSEKLQNIELKFFIKISNFPSFLEKNFQPVSFSEENNEIEIKIQNVTIPLKTFVEAADQLGSCTNIPHKTQKNLEEFM